MFSDIGTMKTSFESKIRTSFLHIISEPFRKHCSNHVLYFNNGPTTMTERSNRLCNTRPEFQSAVQSCWMILGRKSVNQICRCHDLTNLVRSSAIGSPCEGLEIISWLGFSQREDQRAGTTTALCRAWGVLNFCCLALQLWLTRLLLGTWRDRLWSGTPDCTKTCYRVVNQRTVDLSIYRSRSSRRLSIPD